MNKGRPAHTVPALVRLGALAASRAMLPTPITTSAVLTAAAYPAARRDRDFQRQLSELLRDYSGRPTPLGFASRLTEYAGGPRIFLKREDLSHTGAHKINNALGQALLA